MTAEVVGRGCQDCSDAAVDRLPTIPVLHDVADQVSTEHLQFHLESMVLPHRITFGLLQVAVLEIAKWCHRHYFAEVAVQHCTSDLDCNL